MSQPMTFSERRRQSRRLEILKLLSTAPGYEASHPLIFQALPAFGLSSSMDEVAIDLAWLAEQGLVAASDLAGLTMARITARGDDVAAGRARVPGVQVPLPG